MTESNNLLFLDDFARDDLISRLGTRWQGFSDRVMGGVSRESLALADIDGCRALQLTGDVRLDNSGGFIQMALDLALDGGNLDASSFAGVVVTARGNGERYSVHLRTPDCVRPRMSYRTSFRAVPEWQEVRLPFGGFEPYRLTAALDLHRLRRIGLVAIGRAFYADLAISSVALYR